MIRYIALALALASVPAHAAPVRSELCTKLEMYARVVMEARQMEISMSKLMPKDDQTGIMSKIIIEAYAKPAFIGEEYQKRAIDEYANEVAATCYRALED